MNLNKLTFRALATRQNITDLQLSGLTAVDELTGGDTFDGNHQFLGQAVLVHVAEDDAGQRRATSRVVDDLLDQALDVAVALGVVQGAELGGALAVLRLGGEDGGTAALATLTLAPDNATHLGFSPKISY